MLHDPLSNAIWQALITSHRELALAHGKARRYPAAVAPFAALQEPTPAALNDLVPLLAPEELIYLLGERPPEHRALRWDGVVPCLQMSFPTEAPLPASSASAITALTRHDAPEMVELISIAFPGYFRAETYRMGRYWGIRDASGTLIAMGGERLVLAPPDQPVWREISGLCVRPDLPGKGLGTALLAHILAQHQGEVSRSWLHVSQDNTRAISLYQRVGFQTVRAVEAHRLRRVAP